MNNLKTMTLTALIAVCKQKQITVPTFKTGTALADKKKKLISLIEAGEKVTVKGKSFGGEN